MKKVKWCWLARQTSKGWRLGLCLGNDKPRYIPFWFQSTKDIDKVLGRSGKTVFVEMANE